MVRGKQVAIYMNDKDIKRLGKLTKIVTPQKNNRSLVVQKALEFADLNNVKFLEFLNQKEGQHCQ